MKIKIILVSIIVLLIGIITFQYAKTNSVKKDYDIALQNNKAYESQLDIVNNENKAFQFTIEQLEYINDQSVKKLDSLRKELNIKDNKIKQMGNIKEYVYITDSIVLYDTIFNDSNFILDTCLGDEWYTNNLHLEYPGKIQSKIDINTDQSVFLYTTRETINPPKKTWLGRLFQRKHDVYNVTVMEHNPYATIKENKFIIIK